MEKNKKIVILMSLIIFILGGLLFLLILKALNSNKDSSQLSPITKGIQSSTEFSLDSGIEKKSIQEVNDLIEIPDKNKVVVVQIKDIEKLRQAHELFTRAYEGDYVIFTPDRTIVYDGSTGTIRDVSTISLYQYVSQ